MYDFVSTVKLLGLINAPCVYLNTGLRTSAFNRDPAFIGDPASIRTLASTVDAPAFITARPAICSCFM